MNCKALFLFIAVWLTTVNSDESSKLDNILDRYRIEKRDSRFSDNDYDVHNKGRIIKRQAGVQTPNGLYACAFDWHCHQHLDCQGYCNRKIRFCVCRYKPCRTVQDCVYLGCSSNATCQSGYCYDC